MYSSSSFCVPPARSTAEKNTWLQYEKPKIQAPGTTFSNFSHEVRPEGGHGKCCRFVTLTGVHQGAHTTLPKIGLMETFRAKSEKRKCPREIERGQTWFQCLCCRDLFLCFVASTTQVLLHGRCTTSSMSILSDAPF